MTDPRHEDLVELLAQLALEDVRQHPEEYACPREGTTVTPPPVNPRRHLRVVTRPADEAAG